MRFISREMNHLLDYLHSHKEKIQREIKSERHFHHDEHVEVRLKTKVLDELMEYERFVRRVRSECLLVLKEDWMEEVEEAQVLSIPHVLQLDSRYRQLYQLYRLLKMKSYLLHLIPITTTIGNEHIYCMKFGGFTIDRRITTRNCWL